MSAQHGTNAEFQQHIATNADLGPNVDTDANLFENQLVIAIVKIDSGRFYRTLIVKPSACTRRLDAMRHALFGQWGPPTLP